MTENLKRHEKSKNIIIKQGTMYKMQVDAI